MSTYYSFYYGKRVDKNDKISIIGPYIDGKLTSFFTRSRSFIDIDNVINNMTETNISDINNAESISTLEHSTAYYSLASDVLKNDNKGLVKGYITNDELKYLSDNNYSEDSLCEVDIIGFDFIAQLTDEEKREYKMMAAISTRTFGYICSIASEILEQLQYDDSDAEFMIVMIVD